MPATYLSFQLFAPWREGSRWEKQQNTCKSPHSSWDCPQFGEPGALGRAESASPTRGSVHTYSGIAGMLPGCKISRHYPLAPFPAFHFISRLWSPKEKEAVERMGQGCLECDLGSLKHHLVKA